MVNVFLPVGLRLRLSQKLPECPIAGFMGTFRATGDIAEHRYVGWHGAKGDISER